MIVKRKAEDYGLPEGIIEFELTSGELEKAFRIKEKEYRLQDVRDMIYCAYESEQIDEESYNSVKDDRSFHEIVVQEYERRLDCNIPENTTWNEALKAVLEREGL